MGNIIKITSHQILGLDKVLLTPPPTKKYKKIPPVQPKDIIHGESVFKIIRRIV
jgi:hypothetical protein